jgi:hypothetical protein
VFAIIDEYDVDEDDGVSEDFLAFDSFNGEENLRPKFFAFNMAGQRSRRKTKAETQ